MLPRLKDLPLAACLTALLLLAPPCVRLQAQDKPPDQLRTLSRAELDVVKVLTAQENAWNRGDLDGFATGYKDAPDTLFIGRQISRGYAQMLADYKGNYPNRETMGTLGFSDLEPRILDEKYAVVIGKYHLDRSKKAGGPADGIFSLILEKTDRGWKIIVDHTT
jgi:ketosteroid isomerase-like protein